MEEGVRPFKIWFEISDSILLGLENLLVEFSDVERFRREFYAKNGLSGD